MSDGTVTYTRSNRPEPLTVERILDILVAERRRTLIEYFAEKPFDEPIPVQTVAEDLTRLETGDPEPLNKTVKRRYISISQTHLTYLDEVGAVTHEWAGDEHTVTPHEPLTALADILTYIKTQAEEEEKSGRFPTPAQLMTSFERLFGR